MACSCSVVANVLLQFNKQIKKAEGHKPQKVELVISVDAISVVEPKFKVIDAECLIVVYCILSVEVDMMHEA